MAVLSRFWCRLQVVLTELQTMPPAGEMLILVQPDSFDISVTFVEAGFGRKWPLPRFR